MTAPAGAHDAKIRELLLLGNTLDILVHEGTKRGWTRLDVLRVVAENSWKLDPSGRVQRADRAQHAHPSAQKLVAVPTPDQSPTATPLWTVLVEGRQHPVPSIKRRAERLHKQLEELATDIEAAKGELEARQRLAELDAERDRLRAELGLRTGKPGRKAKPINHGTYGGYQAHGRRGEDPCGACNTARDDHMAKMRAARSVTR